MKASFGNLHVTSKGFWFGEWEDTGGEQKFVRVVRLRSVEEKRATFTAWKIS